MFLILDKFLLELSLFFNHHFIIVPFYSHLAHILMNLNSKKITLKKSLFVLYYGLVI